MTALQASTAAAVDAARDELVALAHSLHAEPELAFAEYRSAAKLTDALAQHGFQVRRGVAELPTAFDATFGSGQLVIGLCAEYDALPEVGHACGHNVIAAAALGAGLALAAVADELGITVRVLGTPAEETGGGKVLMLSRGVFDDVAAAMMVHPAPQETVAAPSLALAASPSATPARRVTQRPPRTWAATRPTPSPWRRWPSGCCVSTWSPNRWCTAW